MFERLRQLPLARRVHSAFSYEVDQQLKPLRKEVRLLRGQIEQLTKELRDTSERAARGDRHAAQIKATLELNDTQRDLLHRASEMLDEVRIASHVQAAIASASLVAEPFEHILVERLLPDDVYALLIQTLPPAAFFTDRDPVKQDLPLPMRFGPSLQLRVWGFVDEVLSRRIIRPAVMQKFEAPLQRHYDQIFGPEARGQANALPQATSGGRLMLRRPGYLLLPHRDPKRSLLTCLLYLARPGDDAAYGTQVFRVVGDREAHYKQTYFPEREGHKCELAKVVPFVPNSMLVFLNSRGAHGAHIPPDAPATTERYSYQFYVAPENGALAALLKSLPESRRAMWKSVEHAVWE